MSSLMFMGLYNYGPEFKCPLSKNYPIMLRNSKNTLKKRLLTAIMFLKNDQKIVSKILT